MRAERHSGESEEEEREVEQCEQLERECERVRTCVSPGQYCAFEQVEECGSGSAVYAGGGARG